MNVKMSRLLLLVVAAVGAMVLTAAVAVAQSGSGPASIELEVRAIGDDVPDGFEYSLTAYLDEPGPATPIELDTKVTHEGLAPDTYTLSLETVPPDVLVEWVSCYFGDSGRGQAATATAAAPEAAHALVFDLEPGVEADCEFEVSYEPPPEPGDPAEPGSEVEEPAELPSPSPSPSLDAASIDGSNQTGQGTDPEEAQPAEPDEPDEPEASQAPEPAEPVDEVLAPKPGRWRSVVAASSIDCGPASAPLPRQVDTGPIQVKNGGRRIVIVASPRRIVLDQVDGEPGHYKGTLNDRSTGRVIPLKYDIRVLDPEHMEGTLRANFTAEGTRCTLKRAWDSRYVGE